MSARVGVSLTIAAFLLAAPAATQAQAPRTAFDGTYAGVSMHVSKANREARNCPRGGMPAGFIVANGVVKPRSGKGWNGSVNSQGAVVMQNQYAMHVHAKIDPQGKVTGQYLGSQCIVDFVWQKQAG